jgi:hypothetical protein
MHLYTIIYTTYCLLVSSDKLRKGLVDTMILEREHTHFEPEANWRNRKRFQTADSDYYRTRFEN